MGVGFQSLDVRVSLHSLMAGTALAATCWAMAAPHRLHAQNTVVQEPGGSGVVDICATATNNVVVAGPNDNVEVTCESEDNIAIGQVDVGYTLPVTRSIIIGQNARVGEIVASTSDAISIGTNSEAVRSNGVAIGTSSLSAWNGQALGLSARSEGNGAIAIGNNSRATGGIFGSFGTGGVSVGENSFANDAAVAVGPGASASTGSSVAVGRSSAVSGSQGVSIGFQSSVTGTGSVAIGQGAQATNSSSVAIGQGSSTAAAAPVTSFTVGSVNYSGLAGATPVGTVSFGNSSATRQLTNVAAGRVSANSTDAVNGSQLFAVADTTNQAISGVAAAAAQANDGLVSVAASLGSGASYDAATGVWVAPSYSVGGGTQSDVGTALLALDSAITAASASAVQYDTSARDRVTLGGVGATSPVTLSNVQASTLSASSTDAVNGSQLFATNQAVAGNTASIAALDTRVADNRADIDDLASGFAISRTDLDNLTAGIIDGTVGLVQQAGGSSDGDILLGSATGGTVVNVAGSAGSRRITGVAPAMLSSSSSDAVTGAQLFATNQAVSENTADIASLDGRVTGIETSLAGNSASITNLTTNVADGTIGVVQRGSASGQVVITAAGGTGAAPGEAQVVSNVAAGTLSGTSTEVVNGSQLFATNQAVAGNAASITVLDTRVADNRADIDDLDGRVGVNSVNIANLDNRVTVTRADLDNLTSGIIVGTVGLVQQAGGVPDGNLLVGATTGGTVVSVAGTAGDRLVKGVADGSLSAASSDAVNGSQLFATNQSVAVNASGIAALGDRVSRSETDIVTNTTAITNLATNVTEGTIGVVQRGNTPGQIVMTAAGGTGSAPGAAQVVTNVANGAVTATSSDAVNGAQLFATNVAVAGNTANITNLTDHINGGTIGLVQQAGGDPEGDIVIGPQAGGTVVNVGGISGSRRLTGVGAGAVSAASLDAVNGAQLFALQDSLSATIGRLDNLTGRVDALQFDLNDLRSDVDRGLAGVAALGSLPQSVNPGRIVLGMGSAVRRGEAAFAVGASFKSSDDRMVFNLRAAFDDATTVAVGGGIEF